MIDMRLAILETVKTPQMESILVPDWNTTVFVAVMPSDDKDSFDMSMFKDVAGKRVLSADNFSAKLVCKTVYTEDGKRVFSDMDVAILGRMPSKTLAPIIEVAKRLNGMTENAVEEEAKN